MRPIIDLGYRLRRRAMALFGWRTRGVKAMVRDEAGALLLIRNRYGRSDLWVLPGGGVGWRETPDAAVRREVAEEVGCTLTDVALVGVYRAAAEGRRDTVHLFRASTRDAPRIDAVEVAEARFFAPDALPDALSPATRRRIGEDASDAIRDW